MGLILGFLIFKWFIGGISEINSFGVSISFAVISFGFTGLSFGITVYVVMLFLFFFYYHFGT